MRIPLLIASSLLITACDGRDAGTVETAQTDAAVLSTDSDAAGAFAEPAPTAAEFAQRVAMSDMYEIAAGKIAMEKAASEETREFGRMMVDDHTSSTQRLMAATEEAGQPLDMPGTLDTQHQAQIDILQNLDAEDFDREYMVQQLEAHRKALDLLQNYGANGDNAALRQFAQTTSPVVQQHHQRLERATANLPGAASTAAPMKVGNTSE